MAPGSTTEYTFDGNGHYDILTNGRNFDWDYDYDVMERLDKLTDPALKDIEHTYNSAGLVEKTTNREDVDDLFYYDDYARGLLETTVWAANTPVAQSRTVLHDSLAREIGYRTGAGNWWLTGWNAVGLSNEDTNPEGGQRRRVHDAAGQLSHERGERGYWSSFVHNLRGWLTSYTDQEGHTHSQTFDPAGNLTALINGLGHSWGFAYDDANQLIQQILPEGGTTSISRRDDGLPYEITDDNGVITRHLYDMVARTHTVIEAVGTTVQRQFTTYFDQLGDVIEEEAPNGSMVYTRDNLQQITRIRDHELNDADLTYSAEGYLLTMQDALLRVTTFVRDQLGRATRVIDALGGETEHAYNGDDQEVVYVNQRDFPTTTAFNGLSQTSIITNANGDTYRFGHDKAGLTTLRVDWNKNPTKYDHDGRRLMTRMDDAEGGVYKFIIDGGRRTTKFIDPRGHEWLSGYNKNDWQTSWTDPLLGEFSRTFDGVGNIKTESLPLTALGEETSYDHDELNRIKSVTLPDGAQSFNTWDANDNLTVYQDFRGNQYTYGYNNMNLLNSIGTPENQNFSYTYDAVYNMTVFNDGNGEDWTSVYDDLNRKIKDINPLSKEVEWVYDPTSNVIRFDDQEDDSYQTIYDPLNRPIEQIDPLLHSNKIEYDANSNVTATIDANNYKTEYKYDGLDRRYEIKDARGFITQMIFDPNSNMTKLIDGVGNTTDFEFDERNLLTKRTDPNGKDVRTLITLTGS